MNGQDKLDDDRIRSTVQRLPFHHSSGKASPVDIVRMSWLRSRELDHSLFEPTRLAFHLLQFVTTGSGAHWVDFNRIVLQAGDILYIRPEQVHSFDANSDHEALFLFFVPETLLQAHIPQLARWQANTTLRPRSSDFNILVELLLVQEGIDTRSSALQSANVGPYVLGAILTGIADIAADQHGSASVTTQRYDAMVVAFEELLDQSHATKRRLDWYSSQLGTTPRTLARACRQIRDWSPKQMIDSRIVLEAKRHLAIGTETVETICYSLGFSDPTNFIKFFKRIAGVTPDAFRRNQRRH